MLSNHQPPSSSLYSSYRLPPSLMGIPVSRNERFAHKHLFIVTGPAGCGKTTVAKNISKWFDLPYIEGDNYHPQINVEKMQNGIALTDADRWDWLVNLRLAASAKLEAGSAGVVLTCSALKKKYRDVIRIAAYNDNDVMIHFIYLRASEAVLLQRVSARQGHFMKHSMIQSQLASLEEPSIDERDVSSIDVSGSPNDVQQLVSERIQSIYARDLDIGAKA